MNKKWIKFYISIFFVLIALIYSLPNIYPQKAALQLVKKSDNAINQSDVLDIKQYLKINIKSGYTVKLDGSKINIIFDSSKKQEKARDLLKSHYLDKYQVTLNLMNNTPHILKAIGAKPLKLGLDLRGGIYMLLNVDIKYALKEKLSSYEESISNTLNSRDINNTSSILNNYVIFNFNSKDQRNRAFNVITSNNSGFYIQKLKNNKISISFNPHQEVFLKESSIDQTLTVIRNRVNELGVSEANVAKQGNNAIAVEIPGMTNISRARTILGGTSTLKFLLADVSNEGKSSIYKDKDGNKYLLKNRPILTGKSIVGATSGFDRQTNRPAVFIDVGGNEVNKFNRSTAENIGKPLAVVMVNTVYVNKLQKGRLVSTPVNNNTVINVATINSQLGNHFQITGISSAQKASDLALLIRSGSLPAPIHIVEEQQIGPKLGAKNISMGIKSILIALALVVLFMAIYYRTCGLIADFALICNLFFILAFMSVIPGATLTLPGIAGIVLNLGMSIDANVLIFERIREELRGGAKVSLSIDRGFKKAISTIIDANVTTFIVAIILFSIGTGSVKGFAVTLIIGLITSLFTSITLTKSIIDVTFKKKDKISIGI